MKQQKVKSLGDVYLTLGFKEIQQKSGLEDIERFVRVMIGQGQLKAKIDMETKTVKFLEDDDLLAVVNTIESQNKRIVDLVTLAQDRDEQMRTDKAYLWEVVKAEAEKDQMIVDEQSAQKSR